MIITEVEDLQVVSMDNLNSNFPGQSELREEEVISRAAVEMSTSVNYLVKLFAPVRGVQTQPKQHLVVKELHNLLKWGSITAFVLNVELPTVEEISEEDAWPDEVHHCGILAALMLQGRISNIALDYFILEETPEEDKVDNLFDIMSLVDILATRVDSSFREVLVA